MAQNSITKPQLTRIAPTPSGYLHLGNVLSFAITYALAKKYGAKIMLRIDDLDQNRVRKEYIEDIFETLQFMEIPWHYGPQNFQEYKSDFSQIHRIDRYHQALLELIDKQLIFACSCSRKTIALASSDGSYPGTCRSKNIGLDKKNINWRIKTFPKSLQMKCPGNTLSTSLPASMHDFVVRKKDGAPAYQLASVIDDIHYGVDLIIRGEDLFGSSLAQLYLAGQLPENTFQKSYFFHHPLIMAHRGQKLSKSKGATSIFGLRASGHTKENIYLMMGKFMGFTAPTASLDEFKEAFNGGLVNCY